MGKRTLLSILLVAVCAVCFASVELKSIDENYYRYLILHGDAVEETMNWRTLSNNTYSGTRDSSRFDVWNVLRKEGSGPWTLHGPSLFSSFNSAAPYGQNDAALWQGRGINAQLRFGIEYRSEHFTAVLKPELDFSQNLPFDIMQASSNYDSPYAYFWTNTDMPQRFGDKAFFTFDWGDSEIRFNYRSFTIGFGTQSVWTGHSYLNSILHSNNAPTYPRLDFGFNRTELGIGDFELRFWVGQTGYSKYYKDGFADRKKVFTGISMAYSPAFAKNLTFGINGTVTDYWDENWWKDLFGLGTPFIGNATEDGKMEFSLDWLLPSVGLELYGSIGIDDWLPDGANPKIVLGMIRYPFHTMVYQFGLRKTIDVNAEKNLYGVLIMESTFMEMSQDFYAQWPYTFYSHGNTSFTNNGQIIGSGSGWGGNSQIVAFELYYPSGTSTFYVERSNPDNNFIYSLMFNRNTSDYTRNHLYAAYKSCFTIGAKTSCFLNDIFTLSGGLMYNLVINNQYKMDNGVVDSPSNPTITRGYGDDTYLHNLRAELGFSFSF